MFSQLCEGDQDLGLHPFNPLEHLLSVFAEEEVSNLTEFV